MPAVHLARFSENLQNLCVIKSKSRARALVHQYATLAVCLMPVNFRAQKETGRGRCPAHKGGTLKTK